MTCWHLCIRIVTVASGLLLGSVLARGQATVYPPMVKTIPVRVGPTALGSISTDVRYCISFGDEETNRIDEESGRTRTQRTLMLLHPIPEVAARMPGTAPHRWYLVFSGGARDAPVASLLRESAWKNVPFAARHVLEALGVDDPDLILISCKILSGSISVYYHPRYDRDRAFYELKLKQLQDYLQGHDMGQELPLRNVVHADTGAA